MDFRGLHRLSGELQGYFKCVSWRGIPLDFGSFRRFQNSCKTFHSFQGIERLPGGL